MVMLSPLRLFHKCLTTHVVKPLLINRQAAASREFDGLEKERFSIFSLEHWPQLFCSCCCLCSDSFQTSHSDEIVRFDLSQRGKDNSNRFSVPFASS